MTKTTFSDKSEKPDFKGLRKGNFGRFALFLCFLVPVSNIEAQTGSHQTSAQSVVSITAKRSSGTSRGSGFVWSKPEYVVTALHVVAGASSITVYSEFKKSSSDAKIVAAFMEADLALLKLDENLGLSPVKEANANPNSTGEYYIWGYPRDVAKMQGDNIRFSLSLNQQQPTLKSIFKSTSQLKKTVGAQGYPSIDAKILRISSTIQPGHSGAPIFDKSGRVIGIGDGGLRQGIARLNWAIPASHYLPNLPGSEDPFPGKPSVQSALMSAEVEDEKTVATDGESVLRKVWTASLKDVVATVDEDLAEIFASMNKDAKEESGRSLESAFIDVYEDDETGATIAVPKGFVVNYDRERGLLKSEFGGSGKVEMIVQIVINETWEDGEAAMRHYEKILDDLATWKTEPEFKDEITFDEEDEFYIASKFRYTPDENDETTNEMNMTLVIDDGDFLGAAVVAYDMGLFEDREWFNYFLMSFCVELADFTID